MRACVSMGFAFGKYLGCSGNLRERREKRTTRTYASVRAGMYGGVGEISISQVGYFGLEGWRAHGWLSDVRVGAVDCWWWLFVDI